MADSMRQSQAQRGDGGAADWLSGAACSQGSAQMSIRVSSKDRYFLTFIFFSFLRRQKVDEHFNLRFYKYDATILSKFITSALLANHLLQAFLAWIKLSNYYVIFQTQC